MSRDFLDIQSNTEVTVEIQDGPREKKFKGQNGEYSKWMYDVIHNGEEVTIGATKGLQNALAPLSPRPGDIINIGRTGQGLDTRWAVAYERGESGAIPKGPERTSRPGLTIDDYWATFDSTRSALELRDDKALSDGEAAIAAAIITNTILAVGITFPGYGSAKAQAGTPTEGKVKKTPEEYVEDAFARIKVPFSNRNDFARHLFGEHVTAVEDVTKQDAEMVYLLTEKGTNLEPLKATYETWSNENSAEDDEMPWE